MPLLSTRAVNEGAVITDTPADLRRDDRGFESLTP
jgi:hypothetical protein